MATRKRLDSSGKTIVTDLGDSIQTVFLHEPTYANIKRFVNYTHDKHYTEHLSITEQDEKTQQTIMRGFTYTYPLSRYLLFPYEYNDPEHSFKWRKIQVLKPTVPDETRTLKDKRVTAQFVMHNILKLIWDIFKALLSLYKHGYYHNDTRLDNIGFIDGVFVLYDYDQTHPLVDGVAHLRHDLTTFLESIKFSMNEASFDTYNADYTTYETIYTKFSKIATIWSVDDFLYTFFKNESIKDSIAYLDGLTIQRLDLWSRRRD